MTGDTESIQKLLTKVKHITDIDDKVQEERRKRGELFNVFNVIGLWSEEVRLHSAFLAELLDPKGRHGLQDAFLKEFIDVAGISDLNFETSNSTVLTEYYIGKKEETTGGRIDILIQSEDKAIIIENKIYAPDQENQLLRYSNYGKEYAKGGYRLLYLTLDGKAADVFSTGKNINIYKPLSYEKHILDWLNRCVEKSACQPLLRETIRQYIELIKQLTNNTMDNISRDELINLLSEKENIESVRIIKSLYKDVLEKRIEKYVFPKLEDLASKLNLELSIAPNKVDHNFTFDTKRDGNDFDFHLYFSTKKNPKVVVHYMFGAWNLMDLRWGIDSSLSSIKSSQKLDVFDDSDEEGWNWVEGFRNWNDKDTFKRVLEGKFAEKVKEDLSALLQELKTKQIIK
jgi:hypothetical protein